MGFLKRYFRWILMAFLFLFATLFVFSSVTAVFVLPLLLLIFMYLHALFKEHSLITFLWRTLRASTTVYFASLISFLIYTPEWMKSLSLFLDRYSFFKLFTKGSFMYGRIFVSFILFGITFFLYFIEYKLQKKQPTDEATKQDF